MGGLIGDFLADQFMVRNLSPLHALVLLVLLVAQWHVLYHLLPLLERQAWGLTKIIGLIYLLAHVYTALVEEYPERGEFGGSVAGARAAVIFCSVMLWDMLWNWFDTKNPRQVVLRKHHAFTVPIFLRMAIVGYAKFYNPLLLVAQLAIIAEVLHDMQRLEPNKLNERVRLGSTVVHRDYNTFLNAETVGHYLMVLVDIVGILGNLASGFYLEAVGISLFTYFHVWVSSKLTERITQIYHPPPHNLGTELTRDQKKALELPGAKSAVQPLWKGQLLK